MLSSYKPIVPFVGRNQNPASDQGLHYAIEIELFWLVDDGPLLVVIGHLSFIDLNKKKKKHSG